jgi:hypothetical protein
LIRIQEYQNYLNTNVNTIMNNSTSSLTKLDQVVSGFSNVDIANFPANFPDVDVKNLITTLNSKIDSLNGKIDAITGGTTPAVTTLSGRSIEEKILFNAVAITDTSYHFGNYLDCTKYNKIMFYLDQSLNQSCTLTLQMKGVAITSGNLSDATPVTLASGLGKQFLTLKDFGIDITLGIPYEVSLIAQCATAPTSGSLNLVSWGVIN